METTTEIPTENAVSEAIEFGVTILTPTRRLARAILLQQRKRHSGVALREQILSLEDWTLRSWEVLVEAGCVPPARLLSDTECQMLWTVVVDHLSKQNSSSLLIQPGSAAHLASQCRKELRLFEVPMQEFHIQSAFKQQFDSEIFLTWYEHCQQLLLANNWVLTEDLPELISSHALESKGEAWLIGLTRVSPAHQRALQENFDRIRWFQFDDEEKTFPSITYTSPRQEMMAAAAWAHAKHKEGRRTCLVLADFERDRFTIEYYLREVFNCLDQEYGSLPVNFSRGLCLADVPMFRVILLIGSSVTDSLTRDQILCLLRSRYISDGFIDRQKRAKLIEQLFNTRFAKFDTRILSRHLDEIAPDWGLAALWRNCLKQRLSRKKKSMGEWGKWLNEQLILVGWPGATPLDSIEFQQIQQFETLLDALERQPIRAGVISLDAFLKFFLLFGKKSLFQPKTAENSVQVLDLTDTAGLYFDEVRLIGATADVLPRGLYNLPCIPISICKRFGLKAASYEFQISELQMLLNGLAANTEFLLSTHLSRDGVEVIASRFCSPNAAHERIAPHYERRWDLSSAGKTTQAFEDVVGPQLSLPRKISGGTKVLEDQVACPMKAWLSHHIAVRPLRTFSLGLAPFEQGNLAHGALYQLWSKLRNRDDLLDLSQTACQALAAEVARTEILKVTAIVRERVGQRVLALEADRLTRILSSWLSMEQERTRNFRVEALEHPLEWTICDVTLNLKIDRIDRFKDGTALIIDYKTGGTDTYLMWLGETLKSPQLPVYSLAIKKVAGIALSHLSEEDPTFQVLGTRLGVIDVDEKSQQALYRSNHQNFGSLQLDWQDQLSNLMAAIIGGEAHPTPNSVSCRTCKFSPICRKEITVLDATGENNQ